MNYYQEIMKNARCSICFQPFTSRQWEDRHTSLDGEDCHGGCCDHPDCVQLRIDQDNEAAAQQAD